MSGEYGEPWEYVRTKWGHSVSSRCNPSVMSEAFGEADCPTEKEMKRICACVNFLAGVPSEDLVKMKSFKDAVEDAVDEAVTNALFDAGEDC